MARLVGFIQSCLHTPHHIHTHIIVLVALRVYAPVLYICYIFYMLYDRLCDDFFFMYGMVDTIGGGMGGGRSVKTVYMMRRGNKGK